jgi:SOS-response transcriptional repressor LexA
LHNFDADKFNKETQEGEGCYQLKPESTNPANKPIYIFEDFSIQGIAVDVLKKGR